MSHKGEAGRGAFITLEGIEGAGKSTAVAVIRDGLAARGVTLLTTREPGGTAVAEKLRDILLARPGGEAIAPEAEVLMMFAARVQHLSQVIRPALARGDWVVCDRYTDATFAYQGGGRGVAPDRIRQLADWLHGDCWPDLTLLLDVDESIGRERAASVGTADRFEAEDDPFLARARSAYRALAAADPGRFRSVDANQDQAAVAEEVRTVLDAFCDAWSRRVESS